MPISVIRQIIQRTMAVTFILCCLGTLPGWAQQSQPVETKPREPVRLEPTVVTATRTARPASEVPVPVIVIPPDEIKEAPAKTADDLIRNVPGTNLSRGSSTVTHPTGQSVGIRGIGSNRALVLVDGVPINDAFGGWVNWSKVPLSLVDQIEVVKGGGSSLYGTYAMGGVINILTKVPERRAVVFEGGYGSLDTSRLNLYGSEVLRDLALSLNVNSYKTDGYKVVPHRQRGPVDQEAHSDSHSVNLKADYRATPDLKLSATLNGFHQDMNVGTPITNNARETLDGSTAVTLGLDQMGELKFTLFTQLQEFRNTNSRIGPGRLTETVALRQFLPTFDLGGSLQWSRHVSDFWNLLTVGVDMRRIWGENREKIYGTTAATAGRFLRRRDTEATQSASGLFGEVEIKPVPAWQISVSARGDYWMSFDATRVEGGSPPIVFEEQEHLTVSPKIATKVQLAEPLAVRGALYRAIRFPTINELYRGFFSGNISFEGNPALGPEELWGGEVGIDLTTPGKRLTVRLTPFYNVTRDLITFVTKTRTLRQRENAAEALSQGVELETRLEILRELTLTVNYVFTDSRFLDFRRDRALDGKRLPGVPEHQATASLRFSHPAIGEAMIRARYLSNQFADDRNQDELDRHFVLDLSASRQIVKGVELFAIVENITDESYFAGRSGTIGTLAPPFQAFGGVRLAF